MAVLQHPIDTRGAELAMRLAAVIARPLDALDEAAFDMPPLAAAQLKAIAAHPSFRTPLNRAVSRYLGLQASIAADGDVSRMTSTAHARLAMLLTCEPMMRVSEAAVQMAAAILHRRVVGVVMKADRERIRAIFGEAAFQIATQEAPLLHPSLAELDIGRVHARILSDGVDLETAKRRLIGFGLQALGRFVDAVSPALSELFVHRAPPRFEVDARQTVVGALSEGHCDHIVRLLRRRMSEWPVIIG